MEPATRDALVGRLARFETVVEVAVGERTAVAEALADRSVGVGVTDVRERSVPDGLAFAQDDLTDPDPAVYESADALFAQNLPAELQQPALELADRVGARVYFTTLGAEEPLVPVVRETLPGETLYRAVTGP